MGACDLDGKNLYNSVTNTTLYNLGQVAVILGIS